MVTDKIRFAVVGCGHIGKRHIEMINRNLDAELVAACDILPYEQLGLDNSVERSMFTHNFETVLQNCDVLNICTPNGLHSDMAIRALNAGCNVVIEKPMALNTKDAENVLFAAEKNNCKVFCVMQNRYSPPSVWLKELVNSNRLGQIFNVQVNCFWNRDERYYTGKGWHGTADMDGGTLFTQFSHFIDLMYWLFGDIYDICSRFEDFNHNTLTAFEDSGFISFRFKNGGIGNFNFSTSIYDKNFESSVTIIAEKGTVKVGGQYMNEVEYCNVKDYIMPELPPTNPGNDYGAYKGSAQNHHFVIENVVDVLKNKKGIDITTNAHEGYKVVDIIERMYDAAN
ncbi:UDP-N-acetyl-2-amino-2-deoxyglucuronate dehydrogenase [Dysgonomonadaceae bacterium PH5-43]|nr:UDP-N-acetyl-2-amino-2-deoxyglucuronate dehydrogenase [Dysgonomonadaceae bacterium PH5-43]